MKEEQKRKVDRHGISFRGRYYQNKTMIKDIINKKVNIRYDKRDISVLYVFLDDGSYYCEVYCEELLGHRLSIWEDEAIKKGKNPEILYYKNTANGNLNRNIYRTSTKNKKPKVSEEVARNHEQIRQYNKADIHTGKVKEVLDQVRYNPENENDDKKIFPEIIPDNPSTLALKRSSIRRI
jgi:hypothetical protein